MDRELADVDSDGRLDLEEFIIHSKLVDLATKELDMLPDILPPSLVCACTLHLDVCQPPTRLTDHPPGAA